MKTKEPVILTDEQVLKNAKLTKGILGAFSVIFLLLVSTCMYITITKGFGVFSILPLTFLPILIANVLIYKKSQDEAKKRNLI